MQAITSERAALLVVVAAGLASVVWGESVWFRAAAAGAAVIAVWSVSRAAGRVAPATLPLPAAQAAPVEESCTTIAATIHGPALGPRLRQDLQQILAGIIADERGRIVSRNGSIVATFSGSDGHAGAAIQAARRMLSNVDALARRLEQEIRIGIGVHAGSGEDLRSSAERLLERALAIRVGVLVSESAFSESGAEKESLTPLEGQSPLSYTFAPVQRRLPFV